MESDMNFETEFFCILKEQSDILDSMLAAQAELRNCVRTRVWSGLEEKITAVSNLGHRFSQLDERREALLLADKNLVNADGARALVSSVRSKLSRSKIENDALLEYIRITREFISGVLDHCVPQRSNTLYTSSGTIRKPTSPSVVVNVTF